MATETVGNEKEQYLPLRRDQWPNIDHIITEDDQPVDNIFSEKQQRLLTEPLYSSWSGGAQRNGFIALANVGLFYQIRMPPYVPDMMLATNVQLPDDLWPRENRSYFTWMYGKPPDVAVEVVSNREGGENTQKLTGYANIRIPYYVIFDPGQQLSDEILCGYELRVAEYVRIAEPLWFPSIGLGLRPWRGCYEDHENGWIRWVNEKGEVIPTGAERAQSERQRADQQQQRADQQQQRADQQQQRADQQQQRADQQQQRAERLAAKLRNLGVEPDG